MNPMTDAIEIKNKRISGVTTSVITGIMILFLLLMQFKIEPPKPEEEGGGVAVSLGEPDAGGPAEVPVEAYQPPTTPTFQPREAEEQTPDADAVPVPKTTQDVKKTETPKTPVEDDILRKLKESAQTNRNKPTNGGSGSRDGNQGAADGINGGHPNGNGTGTNGTGPGPNEGVGTSSNKSVTTSFIGRKLKLANNTENCGEKGTVIVDVTVKADGTIIPTGINIGTKSSSQCLQNLAMKFVRNSKFAASDVSSEDGTITIKFTLN